MSQTATVGNRQTVTTRVVSRHNTTLGFTLSNGQTVTSAHAYRLAKQGKLQGAVPVVASNGEITKQSIRLTSGSIQDLRKVIATSVSSVATTASKSSAKKGR